MICMENKCTAKVHARGLCKKHYDRWHKNKTDLTCNLNYCNVKHYKQGLCPTHYNEWLHSEKSYNELFYTKNSKSLSKYVKKDLNIKKSSKPVKKSKDLDIKNLDKLKNEFVKEFVPDSKIKNLDKLKEFIKGIKPESSESESSESESSDDKNNIELPKDNLKPINITINISIR